MRKTNVAAAVLILVLSVGAILFLRAYKLDLIQVVVENAVIQKVPPGYDKEFVRREFDSDLRKARRLGHEAAYLDALMRASQRLEKVQQLDRTELQAVLADLNQAAGAPRLLTSPPLLP